MCMQTLLSDANLRFPHALADSNSHTHTRAVTVTHNTQPTRPHLQYHSMPSIFTKDFLQHHFDHLVNRKPIPLQVPPPLRTPGRGGVNACPARCSLFLSHTYTHTHSHGQTYTSENPKIYTDGHAYVCSHTSARKRAPHHITAHSRLSLGCAQ